MAEKGKPRRKRGVRIDLSLVVAPPGGMVLLDPLTNALKAAAKEAGLRVLDADVLDFRDVMGSEYHGWESEGESGVPW